MAGASTERRRSRRPTDHSNQYWVDTTDCSNPFAHCGSTGYEHYDYSQPENGQIVEFTTTGVQPASSGSVSGDGSTANVGIHCTANYVCTGETHLTVTPVTRGVPARAAASRGPVVLGSTAFRVRAHARKTVHIKLNRAGRRAVHAHRKLLVTQVVSMRIPGKRKPVTTTSKLTLRRR